MTLATTLRTKLSPATIARQWGVAHETVLGWIHSGELKAINAAPVAGRRPRFLVDVADLEAFERRRSTAAPALQQKQRRVGKSHVIEFFK